MLEWLKNFKEHPKTTMQGVVGGAAVVAILGFISSQAGCNWDLVSWSNVAAFAIPAIIGGGAKS